MPKSICEIAGRYGISIAGIMGLPFRCFCDMWEGAAGRELEQWRMAVYSGLLVRNIFVEDKLSIDEAMPFEKPQQDKPLEFRGPSALRNGLSRGLEMMEAANG